jgi:trimeric autotransporter adhesin
MSQTIRRSLAAHIYRLLLALAIMANPLLGLFGATQVFAQTVPSSGYVVGWGTNYIGQTDIPPGLNDVIAIAANQTFSLALKQDGTIVGWGSNLSGQLNISAGLSNVTAIAAGGDHSMALKNDGTVAAWGDNGSGQLDIPAGLSNVTAIAAGDFHSMALRSDGTVVTWGCGGGYDYDQCSVPAGLSGVTAIDGGAAHSLALKNDGTVVAWGNNVAGQGIVPAGLTGVIAISAGNLHNLALLANGTVVAWGSNGSGQTDIPAGLSDVIAISAGHIHSLARKRDGSVVEWGGTTPPEIPVGISGVIAIAAGSHSLALIPPPSVTINQAIGQADPATSTPILFTASFSKPVSDFTASDVSFSGTANLTNATVTISGGPSIYTISVDGVIGNGTIIATIPAGAASDMNGYGNLASTSSDNSIAATLNPNPPIITPSVVGTLGNNGWYVSNVMVSWTVEENGAAISSQAGCTTQNITSDTRGVTFSCSATSASGGSSSASVTIKRDTTAPIVSAAATSLPNSAGWYNADVTVRFNCFDAIAGVANCPADQILNSEGLAVSSTAQTISDLAGNVSTASGIVTVKLDKTAPVVTVTGVTDGASYPTGGAPTAGCTTSDAFSGVVTQATLSITGGSASGTGRLNANCSGAIDRAGNRGSARVSYTVGVRLGHVVAWGYNEYGQTTVPSDLGGIIAVAAGRMHSLALKSDGTVAAWGLNSSGQTNVPTDLRDVIAIAGGGEHSMALKSDGTVVGWGDMGVPAGLNNVSAIATGAFHSLALKRDGTVVAWGSNTTPGSPNAVPATLRNVVAIAVGTYHSLALKSDGTVVAWGRSVYDAAIVPAGLNGVVAIAAGGEHNLVVKSDGTVVAWGLNASGQTRVPATLSGVVAVAGGYDHSIALNEDGTVVGWGRNAFGQATAPARLNTAFAIASGANHNLALEDAPEVAVNQAAQQNDPTTSNPVLFTAAFSEAMTGLTASGVTLAGTANLTNATVTVSGGPSIYTIRVDNVSGNGTVVVSLADGVAATSDGRTSLASIATDNSVTFVSDSTGPIITPTVVGSLGSNGWYISNVAISWAVTDAESAISNQTGCTTQNVTSNTTGVTFTCSASSVGGNTSQSVTIKRDATPPVITLASRTPANAAGWNNSAVTLNWTCSDATSGVVNATASRTISAEGANQSASAVCSDNAGNSASNTQTGINIDTTAPTISAAATSSPNTNGWYNSDVTIAFSCADTLSGVVSCPSSQTLTEEGAAISSTAQSVTDLAGNSATSNIVTAKIDTTAPTISAAATTNPNANAWYNSDVTVAFSCADALSGIAGTCPTSQTLTTEGTAVSSTAQSITDLAGNTSIPSNIVTAKIDRTAPSVSVTGVTNGATYAFGAIPAAACSTSDALSGVATQASLSRSGGSLGLVTVTCAGASDNAGNTAAAVSVSYRVAYGFVGFFQPVDNLPTINTANAGRTIPLKWRVLDAAGNPITNLTSVTITSVAGGCSVNAPADTVEEYANTNTGLMNQGNGYYQFNWQTNSSWRGCRTLQLDLGDGVLRTALFQFR